MPQQLDSTVSTASPGTSRSVFSTAPIAPKALLVAMAVQDRLLGDRRERQIEPPGLRLARQELLEQEGMRREALRRRPGQQRGELVAEGRAGSSARGRRPARRARRTARSAASTRSASAAPRRRARPTGTCGRSRAAAPPFGGRRHVHAVAAGAEHGERRVEVLALEIAIERVGEEHDLAPVRRADRGCRLAKRSDRQRGRARRALKPASASDSRGGARQAVAQVHQPGHARRGRRVARQPADEPLAQAVAAPFSARAASTSIFILRHVDAGRAFAPAALAGDAELQRLHHLVGGERVGAELAR